MIADSITGIEYQSATLAFVVTAYRVKADPTAWSLFTLSG
jgi:hypothetical protein